MFRLSRFYLSFCLVSTLAIVLALSLGRFVSAQYPGTPAPASSEASDFKPGSVLFYNLYTSSTVVGDPAQDTVLALTNTNPTTDVLVRLFLVRSDSSVRNLFIQLGARRTATLLASDVDLGQRGYVLAVAVDGASRCPIQFNHLIGEAAVKFASGHQGNLSAIAVSALNATPAMCSGNTAVVNFDGVSYNKMPRTISLDNIPSRADNNDTLIAINRVGGDLSSGTAATTGNIFGLLYDDAETPFSFLLSGATQVFGSLNDNFPRTTPRISQVIPTGRSGYMKTYNLTTDVALLGAVINFNPTTGSFPNAFNTAHNWTHRTLTAAGSYTLPLTAPDLTLSKTHTGGFNGTGVYTLTVTNNGTDMTSPAPPINVLDTLPANLTLASFGGTGWNCTGVGTANVACSINAVLAAGASTEPLTLTVSVNAGTPLGTNSVTNTATVSHLQDGNLANNNASDPTTIICQLITVGPATPTLTPGTVGTTYNQSFTQSGGFNTTMFSLGAGTLPSGLSLSPAGMLSGTPTQAGSFNFTIKATDANGCMGTQAYTLVLSCPTITVNPSSLLNGTLGSTYSQTVTATGGSGSISWSLTAGALPSGVNLNIATGALTGSFTTAGTFGFTLRATDSNGCFGERIYSVTVIACPTLTVEPSTLANGFVGAVYSQTLTATGGSAPYTFAVTSGSLPGGLTLASGGALTGTPTASGTFSFSVTATDSTGCTGVRAYTVIISGNGLQFFPLPSPVRLLDTRVGATACTQPNAPIAGGTSLTQAGRSLCTIPANAVALTGNITTVNSGGGFLTLYPSNATQPTVASTNYGANEIINNVFTVGLGGDGAFKIFAATTTDVVVDVTGFYAPPATGGLFFHPLPTPVRLLETRAGQPIGCVLPGAPLVGGAESTQQAISTCTGIPAAARAIVGNATTVAPQGGGFLTIFPADATRPLVASSNYNPGQVVNGPFAVGLAANGQFKIFTTATTDLVVDVLGYYSSEATDANGAGLLLTPLAHPIRLLETRATQTVGCFKPGAPLAGGSETTQPARGLCDGITIPANALGVVGNATVVFPAGPGFLTLWPSTALRPTVATLNYNTGDVGNRHFIVGLGQVDGAFKIFTAATTELVIDLSGYFAP